MRKSFIKKNIKETLILSTVILFLFILVVSMDKPEQKLNTKFNNEIISTSQVNTERKELLKEKRHDHEDLPVAVATADEAKEEDKPVEIALNTSTAPQKVVVQPQRAVVASTTSRGTSRKDEELYWLARIIEAEAEGESFTGKVAVGNVILNRVNSSLFPNTVYGVIFDKQNGYTQFSPVRDGRIYNTPSSESIKAAQAALGGQRPVGDALYFLNPSKSQSFWITKNRKYMTTIGDHQFYY